MKTHLKLLWVLLPLSVLVRRRYIFYTPTRNHLETNINLIKSNAPRRCYPHHQHLAARPALFGRVEKQNRYDYRKPKHLPGSETWAAHVCFVPVNSGCWHCFARCHKTTEPQSRRACSAKSRSSGFWLQHSKGLHYTRVSVGKPAVDSLYIFIYIFITPAVFLSSFMHIKKGATYKNWPTAEFMLQTNRWAAYYHRVETTTRVVGNKGRHCLVTPPPPPPALLLWWDQTGHWANRDRRGQTLVPATTGRPEKSIKSPLAAANTRGSDCMFWGRGLVGQSQLSFQPSSSRRANVSLHMSYLGIVDMLPGAVVDMLSNTHGSCVLLFTHD